MCDFLWNRIFAGVMKIRILIRISPMMAVIIRDRKQEARKQKGGTCEERNRNQSDVCIRHRTSKLPGFYQKLGEAFNRFSLRDSKRNQSVDMLILDFQLSEL